MRIHARGVAIEVEVDGPADGEPLLLVMGLGMPLTGWPAGLVQRLVAHGFRVIRFDNRDCGLSQGFEDRPVAHPAWMLLRWLVHAPMAPPYTLADMAGDAVGVLDALGVARAHVCGASLGGMVAQHLAAAWPSRVRSLVLMMTTPGARHLPGPTWRARQALLSSPRSHAVDDVVDHLAEVFRVIGSPAYPPDPHEFRARVTESVVRAWRPDGTMRQLAAVAADGDRTPLLARIAAPTLVIHGEADPLVPVACGRALVRGIVGAQGDFVPGMGHDLPAGVFDRIADGIALNARRVGEK